jgi:hypothetical protein
MALLRVHDHASIESILSPAHQPPPVSIGKRSIGKSLRQVSSLHALLLVTSGLVFSSSPSGLAISHRLRCRSRLRCRRRSL